jgi:hypothetical protein
MICLGAGMRFAQARDLGTLLVQVQQGERICASHQVRLQSLTPVALRLPCFARGLTLRAWPRSAQGAVELAIDARLRTPVEQHWALVSGQWVTFSDNRLDTLSQTVSLSDGSRMTLPLGDHVRIEFRLEAVVSKASKPSSSSAS